MGLDNSVRGFRRACKQSGGRLRSGIKKHFKMVPKMLFKLFSSLIGFNYLEERGAQHLVLGVGGEGGGGGVGLIIRS